MDDCTYRMALGIDLVRSIEKATKKSTLIPYTCGTYKHTLVQTRGYVFKRWCWQLAVSLGLSSAIVAVSTPTLAQITPDTAPGRSLGTTVTPNGNNFTITGGTSVGTNLFHSFSQFNVNTGETAIFNSNSGIRNIFSRVTGGSRSFIDGLIYTEKTNVNLFLINPSGIVFGPNASLDVGGVGRSSFIATTVDALVWPNGGQFSATNPQGSNSLLTLVGDPSGFLSSLRTPAPIVSAGANLTVYDNQSLLLLGGNVSLDGGSLTAYGGRVELGAVAGAGTVGFKTDSNGLRDLHFEFPSDIARADVSLTNGAKIDVSPYSNGTGIGNISIYAKSVSLTNGSQLVSVRDSSDTSNYSQINVEAKGGSFVLDNSTIDTTNNGSGNAGDISISAQDQVSILNGSKIVSAGDFGRIFIGEATEISNSFSPRKVTVDNSSLNTNNSGSSGSAGDVKINAIDNISMTNGSQITTRSNSNDSSAGFGKIEIAATQGSVILDNTTLSATNNGSANAGDISISAQDQVSILNGSSIFSRGDSGRIFIGQSTAFKDSFSPKIVLIDSSNLNTNNSANSGYAGDISISAQDQVSILNGSKIFSMGDFGRIFIGQSDDYVSFSPRVIKIDNATLNTNNSDSLGSGRAGDIIINAINNVVITNNSSITSRSDNEQRSSSDANFGTIQITALEGTVLVSKSTMSTTNDGSGFAGDISISARDQVSINASKIYSNGYLGEIFIGQSDYYASFSPNVVTLDNTNLNANNSDNNGSHRTGTIDSGFISIQGNNAVSLNNNTKLITSTYRQGDAGYVKVQTARGGSVSLTNDSTIFSTVESGGVGNGGNITIDAGSLSLSNGAELQTLVRGSSNEDGTPGGQGNAGLIIVRASGDVSLKDNSNNQITGIASIVQEGGSGQGGGIGIRADRLLMRNGSQVSVSNLSSGDAGVIVVQARRVVLDNKAQITATTVSRNGGDIDLKGVREYVALSRNSTIETTGDPNAVSTAQSVRNTSNARALANTSGNGGNIYIKTYFLAATPRANSNVLSQAFFGNGGAISINAIRLFNIASRRDTPTTDDIDASSKLGINGTVDANALDIDPSRSLAVLGAERLPPLVAQNCRANPEQVAKNEFIITGRGGLPSNPSDRLSNTTVVADLGDDKSQPIATGAPSRVNSQQREQAIRTTPVSNSSPDIDATPEKTIVQAQGWARDAKGNLILIAQPSKPISYSFWPYSHSCSGS